MGVFSFGAGILLRLVYCTADCSVAVYLFGEVDKIVLHILSCIKQA